MSSAQHKNQCFVSACAGRTRAAGYCERHYRRWKRYGDPMAGGTSRGEAKRFLEEVVMHHAEDCCLRWPFAVDDHGYAKVKDGSRIRKVTRIICERVHGNPPSSNHDAAHSCGKGHDACVAPNHLSWKTKSENQADRLFHGTHGRGQNNPMAKLSDEQVRAIMSMAGRVSQSQIARDYGIAQTTVSAIHRSNNWGWMKEGTAS